VPSFQTRILNAEFVSQDDGRDYPSRESAIEQSIIAAMEIAHDIVRKGTPSTAVEARLQQDGRIISRHVVTLSTMTTEDE
jgi:hypothetical protein